MDCIRRLLVVLCACAAFSAAQSTQGLITGRILNSRNGIPVQRARVQYSSSATGVSGTTKVNSEGHYYLPMLSPGRWNVRVEAEDFQPQELYDLVLPVAARLELDFALRPVKDVWEQGQSRSLVSPGSKTIVTFFGPDVDAGFLATQRTTFGSRGALDTSVSEVIDSAQVTELPLAGRDVYTMLVAQPGVSVDTTTARSLGLSSNGQRASASNFLLDGVENNNALVSGPLTPVAPEMVQEYRISTNNFSAEFGRASGFIANAVTRSGTNNWHGIGYFYVKNDLFNANDFQSNLIGQPKLPLSEYQPGFSLGGPLKKDRLFLSSAWEHLRSRSTQLPACLVLPDPAFRTGTLAAPTRDLLSKFPLASSVEGSPACGTSSLTAGSYGRLVSRPVSVDRDVLMQRVDAPLGNGRHKLTGRYALSRVSRPDYLWSPYRDFVSALDDNTDSVAISVSSQIAPQLSNEIRGGYSREGLGFDRAHSEVPYLASLDGVLLPGSPATATINYGGKAWEFQDTAMWLSGRHIITAGGGVLFRKVDGDLTASRDGEYYFQNLSGFGSATPVFVRFTVDRAALPTPTPAPFGRTYNYNQWFSFLHDTVRLSRRLVVNYGVRWDSLGNAVNTGAVKDALIQPGSGTTLSQQVANGRLAVPPSGDQPLYNPDRNNWAPRVGLSFDPTGSGRTLIRGAWGIFYDRPFENIWMNLRNNRFLLPRALTPVAGVSYLTPIDQVLPLYAGRDITTRFPVLTYIQSDMHAARSQSYFAGVQRTLRDSLVVEINVLGSRGRDLISTDLLNRLSTDSQGFVPYSAIGRVSYRSNEGYSDYNAATALVRYRGQRGFFQAAYTWSHAIDNQSEVLRNDYFDLNPVRLTGQSIRTDTSAFTLEGNRDIDRGNADFDQRHNFVFLGSFDLPQPRRTGVWQRVLGGWRLSSIGAFRAGTPFSVFAGGTSSPSIVNNRAVLVNPSAAVTRVDIPGGEQLLTASAFRDPAPDQVGNSGRNAFRAPGFWNTDISIARTVGARWLGESGRLTFRADIFNIFNHANLNAPENRLGPGFGIASYGRSSPPSGLPSLAPLNETARQIQLMLRVLF